MMQPRFFCTRRALWSVAAISFLLGPFLGAQQPSMDSRLEGFDAYMAQVLKDWNVPGIGVGIVVKDKLVFAKGYGYRDYGKKLPFTPTTTQPIASNTKLFTAVAAGLLVEEGKLDWDKPIRQYVPSIKFYNDDLDRTSRCATCSRTAPASRATISIWYKSDFTQKELFERLKYLEPSEAPRSVFLYNNMMYAGAGYSIELLSGKTWEAFVRDRILAPLGMTSTTFAIADMLKTPEPGVPYTERRDNTELYQIPYYSDAIGVAPAGAMNSNIVDMSKWLIALMNDGQLDGKQVLPGRRQADARARHRPPEHGPRSARLGRDPQRGLRDGTLDGLVSRPSDRLPRRRSARLPLAGVDDAVRRHRRHRVRHRRPRRAALQHRLLQRLRAAARPVADAVVRTSERDPSQEQGGGQAARGEGGRRTRRRDEAIASARRLRRRVRASGLRRARPSRRTDESLTFDFHKIRMPLAHFHYDRFDTPDDEQDGKWSVNFLTNPQGEIDRAEMSLDRRRSRSPAACRPRFTSPTTLRQYLGHV